ncbi:MAG: polyprenyl synthetase family protein [Candidatus Lokiarchaeota archaeon]|nr:polyprenyl synthetase family protein [Candidatus Lokiarchaeota archaeon]
MKFTEYAKTYIPNINNAIGTILDKKLENINNTFLKTYYEEIKTYLLAGGKRIRPLLCIAAYNAFNDEIDDKIITPSVGVEFLHNASLVHDDIIDKDNFRRGNPAFHYRFQLYHNNYSLKKMSQSDFGNSIAIIGGDSIFFLGLEPFLFNDFDRNRNLEAINYYEQAFGDIANGVLIETDMVNRKNLQMKDYIEMVSLKTGALLEKSILIGANYAGIDKEYYRILSTLGINLGIIFQIIDDILGTFGDEKVTGKPTDGDIREGKRTCLLIEAINSLDVKKRDYLVNLISKSKITDKNVEEVRDLFMEADVINSCKKLATKYYQEAEDALEKLKPVINNSEIEFFENLLKFVLERKF